MDYSRPELADRLAAEYAAGLMRGGARRRLESLLPAHPTLRSAVRAWHDRLMPLTLAVTPVEPSAAVWKRIESRLGGGAVPQGTAARAVGRLAFWRAFASIAGLATLVLAVLLATPGPVQPPIIVVLTPTAGQPGTAGPAPASIVASISADGRGIVTRPLVNVNLAADRTLELWSLPRDGAPRSLGLIAGDRATVLQRGRLLDDTDALAVSLEPPGGSTTGAPTGPVLFVGKLSS